MPQRALALLPHGVGLKGGPWWEAPDANGVSEGNAACHRAVKHSLEETKHQPRNR